VRTAGVTEALAAIAGGVAVAVALRLAGVATSGALNAYTWGLVASVVAFGLAMLLRGRRRRSSSA